MPKSSNISSSIGMDKENIPAGEEDLLNQLMRRFNAMRPNAGRKLKDAEIISMEKQVNILRNEFEELAYLIKMNGEGQQAVKHEQTKAKLMRIVEDMQDVEFLSKNYVNQSKELDYAIMLAKKLVLDFHTQIANNQMEESSAASELRLRNLEDRLETTNKKMGTIICENARLREEITVCLKNREIFNKEFNKTIERLFNGKIYLKVMLDQVEQVSSEREVMIEKLHSLKLQGLNDQKRDIKLMQSYSQTLDDVYSLYNFLRVKGTRRRTDEGERLRKAREKDLAETNNKILELDKLLNDILSYRNKSMVGEVIEDFRLKERQMIAVFKYVCFIESCNLKYETQVKQMRGLIEDEKSLREQREMKQTDAVKSLTEQLQAIQEIVKQLREENTKHDLLLERVMLHIKELFESCSLTLEPLMSILGNKEASVTIYNVKWFLKTIAESILEQISVAYQIPGFKARSKGRSKMSRSVSPSITPTSMSRVTVQIEAPADKEPKQKEKKSRETSPKEKKSRETSPKGKKSDKKEKLKKKEPKLQLTDPKLGKVEVTPMDEYVAYVPCAYCTEDYLFSRVEEQPVKPWCREDAMELLRAEPINTPYNIQTYTVPGEVHTARMVRMEQF